MLGSIVGDIIGSIYEAQCIKTTEFSLFSRFCRFTDDTVLTIAIADAILHREKHRFSFRENQLNRKLYAEKIREYARKFPNAGYGQMFNRWAGGSSCRGYRCIE